MTIGAAEKRCRWRFYDNCFTLSCRVTGEGFAFRHIQPASKELPVRRIDEFQMFTRNSDADLWDMKIRKPRIVTGVEE